MSLSIATEWISNQGKESYQKQDCERAAFRCLAASIKNYYSRLPIVIVADGLYPWLSGLTYRNHSFNWVECIEKKVSGATGNIIQQRFVHLTNMEISSELCTGTSDTGRLRQKIENEGFNIQKNNGYALNDKY